MSEAPKPLGASLNVKVMVAVWPLDKCALLELIASVGAVVSLLADVPPPLAAPAMTTGTITGINQPRAEAPAGAAAITPSAALAAGAGTPDSTVAWASFHASPWVGTLSDRAV